MKAFLGREHHLTARIENRPVDPAFPQIGKANPNDRDRLPTDHFFSVGAPFTLRCIEDNPPPERLFARGRDETVDVRFLDPGFSCVALRLDCGITVFIPKLGDQVNPDIAPVPTVLFRPIGPSPDSLIFFGLHGIIPEKSQAETLELGAFFALGDGSIAIEIQNTVNSGHRRPTRFSSNLTAKRRAGDR
jgi:hypothetical protein